MANLIAKSELTNRKIRLGQGLIHLLFILLCCSIILPLMLTVIVSFSSEISVMQQGYSFFPKEWSIDAYKYILSDNAIYQAYWVTIRVTLLGTIVSVLICSLCGFVLSRSKIKYRNIIATFLYIPTIISAGVIPWYYLISEVLNLENTIFVLILPSLVSAYNIFLIRNYYKSIPESFVEAAEIEGAGPFMVFFKVMLPLALPITATVVLFVSLGYWNDWYLATWFIDFKHQELYPLQYFLFKLWDKMASQGGVGGGAAPTETAYLATMFITMGPIILVYPFVQKYFIKGIMVGGVKG